MPDRNPRAHGLHIAAPNFTGQLAAGVVKVLDAGGAPLGYAFTEANGAGQLQRWLLYARPRNNFAVVEDPEHAGWTLATWQEHVSVPVSEGGLWVENSFYVKAQVDLYHFGGTYGGVVWSKIPDPPPGPTFPEARAPSPYQLDDGTGKIAQGKLDGYVLSVRSLGDPENVEYWLLPDGYAGAGGSEAGLVTTISPLAPFGAGLSAFIEAMNKGPWRPGSSFAITGNMNYQGEAPPADP